MKIFRYTCIAVLMLCQAHGLRAQTDTSATDSLPSLQELLNTKVQSQEELMNAPVSIAGQKDQVLQEAPSIISVITKEDIAHYGARDISEILHMVPGFEFGMDVQSITGLSFRGIWVHEGKALVMINGSSINDYGYGNTNLIGTIPAAMIERIEIIRGPGSVLYGGFAGVTVINIITDDKQNTGGHADLQGGYYGSGAFTRMLNASYNLHTKEASASACIGYSMMPLSTQNYTDFYGNSISLNQTNAYRGFTYAIASAKFKGFSINYNRTLQEYPGQDGYTNWVPLQNGKITEAFDNYMESVSAKQEIHVSNMVTIVPSADYQKGDGITSALLPTSVLMAPYGLDGGTKMARYRAQVLGYIDMRKTGQLMLGGGYTRDVLNMTAADGSPGLQVGPNPGDTAYAAHANARTLMAEYTNVFNNIGVTIGSRYESTTFGDAFAPRAGLTYVYNKFNAKLLYGRAFRIPLPFQAYSRSLGYAGNLGPEISNTYELELGYKFSSKLSGRFNVFRIDIEHPIKYEGDLNVYTNSGHIQSRGLEAELLARFNGWGGFLNASSAIPGRLSSSDILTPDRKHFLGIPSFKADAGIYYKIHHLEISPSCTFLNFKYGQSPLAASDSTMQYAVKRYPPVVLFNLSLTYANLLKNLDIRLTGSNLTDSKYLLVQPYYGDHAPMPTFDRHITLTTIIKF